MKTQYLGPNERLILKAIKDYGGGYQIRKDQLVRYIKAETGKTRQSIYRSINNMVEKGMLIADQFSNTLRITTAWFELLKAGKCKMDLQPQALIKFEKRIDVLATVIKNCELDEMELLGLTLLLDLDKSSIQIVARIVTGKEIENKGSLEFDDLVKQYLKR